MCCPNPIVEKLKSISPSVIFLQALDFTKEMIFPVTVGERDKHCGRTFHNNTNAYHAGGDHIHSYKSKDINKVHSVQQDVLLN